MLSFCWSGDGTFFTFVVQSVNEAWQVFLQWWNLPSFSFADNSARRILTREEILLLVESLESSTDVLRAALADTQEQSEPPSPLSGSQTALHETTVADSSIWRRYCNRPTLKRILKWILHYHFVLIVAIQVWMNIDPLCVCLPFLSVGNLVWIFLHFSGVGCGSDFHPRCITRNTKATNGRNQRGKCFGVDLQAVLLQILEFTRLGFDLSPLF